MPSDDDHPPYDNFPNFNPFGYERNNTSHDYPPPTLGHESNKNSFDYSKIMITAITSLALVVVLVIMLHTYARCVLRRQARRRATIRVLGHTLTGVRSSEPPKNGLDPSVIASLPVFVFKQDEENTTTTTECAVCLSMFEEEEMAMVLPNCNHTFHAECIDKWLSSHSTCPICRTEAEPKVLPEAQEGVVGGAPPMASPLEHANSSVMISEGTSDGAGQSSAKVGGSNSRLNSFRRMLTRERSSRIIQPCAQEDTVIQDLERQ